MNRRSAFPILMMMASFVTASAFVPCGAARGQGDDGEGYTTDFGLENCRFKARGHNTYWSLHPGHFLRLEGEEDGAEIAVEITVLRKTKTIRFEYNGEELEVKCRVVREREWEDGELVEISKNYFAICKRTGNVYYFGEDVDIYEDGEVVSHDGAWLAGRNGALPGLIMPSVFLLGSKYYQEIAEADEALDRAKHVRMGFSFETPAGIFDNCVRVVETTPLDPDEVSVKIYAPNVGLIYDDGIELVD